MTNKKDEQVGMKTIKRMQERFKQKQVHKKNRKHEIIKKTEAEDERLDFVAFVLSKKFKYIKLMKAANPEKAEVEGREVHGFMERMFPDYEWLIDNDVLDRACYFAWQDYRPEIYNLIANYDFSNMKRSVVILPEKVHFDHFPELEFDRVIVYSEEPLRKQLKWVNDYEWETEDGYDTTVLYAPCNLLNMGSPLYDLPVAVVSWSLSKNNLFFQAKTTAEDLTREKDELIRNQILILRNKEKNMEDMIDELKVESEGSQKKYEDLKHKMLARDPSTTDDKFKRWEKSYERRQGLRQGININVKKVLLWVLIIGIIIGIGIIVWMIFVAPNIPSTIPETTNTLSLSRLSGGG